MITAQQLHEIDERQSEYLNMWIQTAVVGTVPDVAKGSALLTKVLADAGTLRAEYGLLVAQRQAVRDLHVPMEAEGGRAVCTGCSIGGTLAPWPCPTWKLTDTP